MPIPVLNFPTNNFEQPHHERNIYKSNPEITFAQAHPDMVGAAYSSDLLKSAIENQKQSIAARYMQPQMEEQLKQLRMNTDILRPQAEYAPQFTQASLAEALMKAPKIRSDIGRNEADIANIFRGQIPLSQSHANYYNAQARLAPEHLALDKLRLEQAEKGGGRYGVEAQVLRSLSSPAMQSLIETNPEVAKEVAQILANNTHKGLLRGSDSGAAVPSEQDIASLQGKTGDILTKRTSTAQILNQRQYAVVLDSLFEEGTKLMPSVTKYAGAQGKLQLAKDSAKAAIGEVNPQYSEYLQFTNVVAPNVANEMRRVLGGQATDYEAKVMNNLSNPSFWLTNPTLANQQWNFMENLFKKKISPSLTVGLSGTIKQIKETADKQASPANAYSNEDLEYTAKLRGITVEQVRQQLGVE